MWCLTFLLAFLPFCPSANLVLHGFKVVNSTWNITLDLYVTKNSSFNQVQITMHGPSDRWFGIGYGNTQMSNTYAIISSGTSDVSERKLGNHVQGNLLTSTVTVTSQTTANGFRTIKMTRSINGASSNYYTFPTANTSINLICAMGAASGDTTLDFHQANYHNGEQISVKIVATDAPTQSPTTKPTKKPTKKPTALPTSIPTKLPTYSPTHRPTSVPTLPTQSPTQNPTKHPTTPHPITAAPTKQPTKQPTQRPTLSPTFAPSSAPTFAPVNAPTLSPSPLPTAGPTQQSIVSVPTMTPTAVPTLFSVMYNGVAELNSKFGQKAELSISVTQNLVKLNLYGADDNTWFGIGFNGHQMSGTYAIVVEVDQIEEYILGNHFSGVLLNSSFSDVTTSTQDGVKKVSLVTTLKHNHNFDWETVSNSVSKNNTFKLPMIWSKGQSSTFGYHGSARGLSTMTFGTVSGASYMSHFLCLWCGLILGLYFL